MHQPNSNRHRYKYTIQILLSFSIHLIVTTKSLSQGFIVRRGADSIPTSPKPQPKLPSSIEGRSITLSVETNNKSNSNSNNDDSDRPTNFDSMNNNLIKNFRKASGFEHLYRSASTDALGDLINDYNDNGDSIIPPLSLKNKSSPEYIILNEIGLILDLRSPSERDELKAQKWMLYCTPSEEGKKFTTKTFSRNENKRGFEGGGSSSDIDYVINNEKRVYRLDVLSPTRLFKYLSENWISSSPIERARYAYNFAFDSNGLHEMRMDILNDRGLKGLYEAIIETSQEELCASLRAIVEHFENSIGGRSDGNGNNKNYRGVLVHCVQGKDRYV
jgi:hypothetical protein